jgi:hypothetical protein
MNNRERRRIKKFKKRIEEITGQQAHHTNNNLSNNHYHHSTNFCDNSNLYNRGYYNTIGASSFVEYGTLFPWLRVPQQGN